MPENDDLSNLTDGFSEGLHVNPIPASEVRRRGDRMRRRNTAFATVGGVVAAAVFIGTPVALMNNAGDDSGPDPLPPGPTTSQDADPAWILEIPEDFPLTAGMVTGGGTTFEGGLGAYPLCDSAYPTSPGTSAMRTVSYSDDGESSVIRTFQLWPDDISADASLDELVAAVQACPTQPSMGGEDVVETKFVDYLAGGDRSVTFAQQYVADDGLVSQLSTVQVTRVGNAVLVNSTYGSAGGDEAIEIATEVLANQSATTRAAMCRFSADPCSRDTPDPETSTSPPTSDTAEIPADFPLGDGFGSSSDDEVEGPSADTEGAPALDLCGSPAWEPTGVAERLAVRRSGPEYLVTRELVTFAGPAEAIQNVEAVRQTVRGCSTAKGETAGSDRLNVELEANTGYDSFSWGFSYREGLGSGNFQLTRVGSAVLVLYSAGEGSAESLQTVADEQVPQSADLAAAMCVFTEDGC